MQKKYLIFGIRAVIEAVKAGKEFDRIFIKKNLRGELFQEMFQFIRDNEIPFQYVPVERLNRITGKNHQGVVAYLSMVSYQPIENILPGLYESGKIPFILLLDQVTDVRNFGAIARTAECAGVDAIIIPEKGAAQINADAIKTSAGALHQIQICRTKSLKDTVIFLKESGLKIVAVTEKSDDIYYKKDYNNPVAFILGSEESGISDELLKLSEVKVKIPLFGKIESLNVSNATAIILYEVVKQRHENNN